MHTTVTRTALGLLAAVLLTAGLSAPASAERYIHHDPAHDVRKVSVMSMGNDGFVRAPHRKQGDYVKVKIWHQVRAVRVVGKFRRLDRVGQGLIQIVSIRTPDGSERTFQVFAGPGMWKGVDSDEAGENCVVGHHVNYRRDRFSMRISRSCLDRPRWVKVGVGFITLNRRDLTADDAQLRKVRNDLTYSPRLGHA
ncbi:hypothetical protein [Nocardioides marmoribigeumensis]|uniref:Secreted protein n=1 Tax=Nocardioides marmoribigeumensis TaxID=433649 RepID=A0ABU2BRC6_9ACTN|nr:hypothetical protein [Nocardioides marmoribigeumensis]MDR7361195.1 hypothetical protein [Nocardioides marmoribigeumensis]